MEVKVIDLPPADLVAGTDILLLEQNSGTKNTTVTKLVSDLGLVKNTTLAANSAAQRIGTKSGNNVQVELDKIELNATQTQDEIAQVQTSVAEIESKQEALDQFNIDLQSPSGADLIQSSNGNTVQQEINNFSVNTREQWRRSLAEAGLTLVEGSFEEGATTNSETDAVWHISGGQCYVWSGVFPKTVPDNSTPLTSGGIAVGAWVSVGDASLRGALATTGGASYVSNGGIQVETVGQMISSLWIQNLPDKTLINTSFYNTSISSLWRKFDSDPGDGFVLQGVNCFLQLASDDGDVRHYGVGGGGDETDMVQFALDNGARLFRNIELSVTSINLPTRDYTFDNSVIKRVDTYTGNDHLLAFADGCQCNGSLIYIESNNAGNDNPSTPVNTCVFGKNFRAGIVVASKIQRGTNVVSANRITGDFYCSYMKSFNFDYAGGRVFAADSTGLVRIDTFESINCGVKGFSVNGGMGVDHISFGSYTAKTDSSNTAGDGLLVDTNEDNTVINVQKVTIESYNIGGWYSNAVKVENTDTLSIGDGGLFCGGSNTNRSSLRAAVKNLNVGNLKYGSQLRNYAEKSSIQSLTFETNSAAHANNYPYRIDNLFGNVDTVFNINSLTVIGDSALIGVAGAIRVEPSVDKIKGVIGLYNTPNNLNLLSYSTFNTTGNVGMITIGPVNGLNSNQFGPVLSRNTLFQFGLRVFRHTTVPTWGDYKKGDRVEIINPAAGTPWAYVAIADVPDASVDNSNFKSLGNISA